MSSPPRQTDGSTLFGWLLAVVGTGIVLAEVVGIYAILSGLDVPTSVVYGGTAVTAAAIGGSALYVAGRRIFGSVPADASDTSALARVAEVTVSVTVLTAMTVLVGSVGGLVLTAIAKLGGPDPRTADGDRLRNRLLGWAQRNRDFMQANGRGELPLTP